MYEKFCFFTASLNVYVHWCVWGSLCWRSLERCFVNVKGLYGWCSVWLCFCCFLGVFLQTWSPSKKNGNTVKGFKLHVFRRIKGRSRRCDWIKGTFRWFSVAYLSTACGRNRRWQRVRGLSHISDWKKEIGKVSTVFHSADSDDGVFPSLSDSSGGGGGGSGACVYQVRPGLCFSCQSNSILPKP